MWEGRCRSKSARLDWPCPTHEHIPKLCCTTSPFAVASARASPIMQSAWIAPGLLQSMAPRGKRNFFLDSTIQLSLQGNVVAKVPKPSAGFRGSSSNARLCRCFAFCLSLCARHIYYACLGVSMACLETLFFIAHSIANSGDITKPSCISYLQTSLPSLSCCSLPRCSSRTKRDDVRRFSLRPTILDIGLPTSCLRCMQGLRHSMLNPQIRTEGVFPFSCS